jgi:peptidyl-prolyl cis-trans isomerase D
MLKTMRTNTKWIMIVVAVSFVAMIVFAWGMDITGSRSGGVQAGVIADINGRELTWAMYEGMIKEMRANNSNQQNTIASEQQFHEQVWQQVVTQTLVQQDIEDQGITYSDHELIDFMVNNPSPDLMRLPMFADEDGRFNIDLYHAFVQNPANLNDPQAAQILMFIEQQARMTLPSYKLQMSLYGAVKVTDAQVRERWLQENEGRGASWVFVSASDLPDVAAEADPDAIRRYYEENREDYDTGERRVVRGVFFSLDATAADSTEVLKRANLLTERARAGEDFSELANGYTDDRGNAPAGSEPRGGDLGFFGRSRMVKPFEDAAFAMEEGEISDPVLSQFGYHIIKVDSIRYTDDKERDQIKARHILINVDPSGDTLDSVEAAMRTFNESVTGGMDFTEQAGIDGYDIVASDAFQDDIGFVPVLNVRSQFLVNRVFEAKSGEVLTPQRTDDGWYIIQVADVLLAGIQPFEEVALRVERDWRQSERSAAAEAFVTRIHQRLRDGMALAEATQADTEHAAAVRSEAITRRTPIPGLGEMNALAARLFELDAPGTFTDPLITERGSAIAVLDSIPAIDEDVFEVNKESLRARMNTEQQQTIMGRYIQGLNESAEIVDNRHLFYTGI